MKQYRLKIVSKNEKSLKKFLSFFYKHFRNKFNVIQKSAAICKRKKVITLLKSPHVNKTAQEHFEFRTFYKQILIKTFCAEKNFMFLKKVLNKLFHDVSVDFELTSGSSFTESNRLLALYPDNFKLPVKQCSVFNSRRSKQKLISKEYNRKKDSLVEITKFLGVISLFGEVITLSFSKS